jgi:hypothetical protein
MNGDEVDGSEPDVAGTSKLDGIVSPLCLERIRASFVNRIGVDSDELHIRIPKSSPTKSRVFKNFGEEVIGPRLHGPPGLAILRPTPAAVSSELSENCTIKVQATLSSRNYTQNRVRQLQDFKMGACCFSAGSSFPLTVFQFVTPLPPSLPIPKKVSSNHEILACDPKLTWLTASRARGEYLRTHFKNMREVAAAITGALV